MMGLVGSVLTLGRGMFGSGALAMPYMFSICGLNWGVALLCIFAANATTMSVALVAAAPEARSYEEAVRHCIGPCTEYFLALNILLANTGTVAVYLQVAGERLANASKFWCGHRLDVHRAAFTGACAIVVLPFTFSSTLGATKFASAFSYAVAVVVVFAIVSVSWGHEEELSSHVDVGSLLQGVPLSCYAFSAMSQVFPVYTELPQQTSRSMARVVAIAACVAGFLYAVLGAVSAKHFGNATEPDILSNVEDSYPSLFHCLGSLYAVSCLLGVPLMLFPSRRSLNYLLFRGEEDLPRWVWAFESTMLIAIACALAAISGNILVMLDLIGSVSAIAVDNVLPGIIFLVSRRRCRAALACQTAEECHHVSSFDSDQLKRIGISCMVVIGVSAGSAACAHSVQKALSQ